jgi:hypothetical protein
VWGKARPAECPSALTPFARLDYRLSARVRAEKEKKVWEFGDKNGRRRQSVDVAKEPAMRERRAPFVARTDSVLFERRGGCCGKKQRPTSDRDATQVKAKGNPVLIPEPGCGYVRDKRLQPSLSRSR